MSNVGVLLPLPPSGPTGAPRDSWLGKTALRLAGEGIRAIFGARMSAGVMTGFDVSGGKWNEAQAPVAVVYDMWPSNEMPGPWKKLLGELGGARIGNPADFTESCSDRLQLQRMLEMSGVMVTPMESKPERFGRVLEHWGAAFVKPRFRGTGRRVQHIVQGDAIPESGEGRKQLVLQQSRGAPAGWEGMVVRWLAQRELDGSWRFTPPVAFRSRRDKVAGSSSESVVDDADRVLPAPARMKMRKAAEMAVDFLCDDPHCVEIGLDFALDRFFEPWLIDAESKPKMGLLTLAKKQPGVWDDHLFEVHARPIRTLARGVK